VIVLFSVECPGCEAQILLRLGVGDERAPFYVICGRCHAPIRGVFVARPSDPPTYSLELTTGRVLEELIETHDQTFTLHPDFPTLLDAGSMEQPGGSPFIMAMQQLGDSALTVMHNRATFLAQVHEYWPTLQRWFIYYLDENWSQFDVEAKRFFDEIEDDFLAQPWVKHDAIHRALDLVTAPGWFGDLYVRFKSELWGLFEVSDPGFIAFSKTLGDVRDRQRNLFHCLDLVVERREAWLPAALALFYKDGGEAAFKELRISRDDFPALRDVYIASFEACQGSLDLVVAILNLVKRGDPDNFGTTVPPRLTSQGVKRPPRHLGEFRKLPVASKAEYLVELPGWYGEWPVVLDRSLRNAIGHHSVHHDLASGTLQRDNGPDIPYIQFAAKVQQLLHPLLTMLNVVKLVRIASST
jgi:hypothetical protein